MIKFQGTESATLEFKRQLPKNNQQIVKTLIGFCNHFGGRLIVGVDNDGSIVGIDENEANVAMEWLDKMVYESCTPPIIPSVYLQRIGNKIILIIEVTSGMNKPYFQTSLGMAKGTYIRLGRSTLRADADIIEELKWQSRGLAYEEMPVYSASEQEMSEPLFKSFLKERKQGHARIISQDLYLAYKLMVREHHRIYPSVAGILLFGESPQRYFSEAAILCTHFEGSAGRKALSSRDCNGSLFEQLDASYNFIVERLGTAFEIKEKRRKEQSEIPLIAVREMLINAIVHRNYHIKAPIKIALYSDRLEIFSPGGFPGPLSTDRLLQGITYIRNAVICRVFREAGYIEKLGTGFITLFSSYEESGLEKPTVIDDDNFVKCILPRTKRQSTANPDERRILELLRLHEEISISDVVEHLTISRAKSGRLLARLVETGAIVNVGKGRGSRYKLRLEGPDDSRPTLT
jgi:ATP-dependent DNA helicase RecG